MRQLAEVHLRLKVSRCEVRDLSSRKGQDVSSGCADKALQPSANASTGRVSVTVRCKGGRRGRRKGKARGGAVRTVERSQVGRLPKSPAMLPGRPCGLLSNITRPAGRWCPHRRSFRGTDAVTVGGSSLPFYLSGGGSSGGGEETFSGGYGPAPEEPRRKHLRRCPVRQHVVSNLGRAPRLPPQLRGQGQGALWYQRLGYHRNSGKALTEAGQNCLCEPHLAWAHNAVKSVPRGGSGEFKWVAIDPLLGQQRTISSEDPSVFGPRKAMSDDQT